MRLLSSIPLRFFLVILALASSRPSQAADPAFTGPEIAVFTGASTMVADERSDGDVHDFGPLAMTPGARVVTFTIQNQGTATLSGISVSHGGGTAEDDFEVGDLGATALAPGGTTTFGLTISPSGRGVRSTVITITSNDSDEALFEIPVTGSAVYLVAFSDGSNLIEASGVVVDGIPLHVIFGKFPLRDLQFGRTYGPFYFDASPLLGKADLFSQALFDQVLVGAYRGRPSLIRGCNTDRSCQFITVGSRVGAIISGRSALHFGQNLLSTGENSVSGWSVDRAEVDAHEAADDEVFPDFDTRFNRAVPLDVFEGEGMSGAKLIDNGVRWMPEAEQTITLSNNLVQPLTNLSVSVSGRNPDRFVVDTSTMLTDLAIGETTSFVVTPSSGPYGAVIEIIDVSGSVFRLRVGIDVPTLKTPLIGGIKGTSARLGGKVVTDGGSPILSRGIVIAPTAVNGDPEIGGAGVSTFTAAPGKGDYDLVASGLTPGTRYSFKAFATNAAGTAYSTLGGFATKGPGDLPVSITVVPPGVGTPGSVTIANHITLYATTTGTTPIFLVMNDWIDRVGLSQSVEATGTISYRINGGPIQPLDVAGMTDHLARSSALVTPRDGFFYTSSEITVEAGDEITIESGSFVLPALPDPGPIPSQSEDFALASDPLESGFHPEAAQTFTGQVYLTDLVGESVTNFIPSNPAGTDTTIPVKAGESYPFTSADWGFTDGDDPEDQFTGIQITSLPTVGVLTVDEEEATAGQFVSTRRTQGGGTWVERGSEQEWGGIASSADGSKLAAVAANDFIYTSTDSGATWTPRESPRRWRAITSSADGSRLAAVVDNGGNIYTSDDSGITWTERATARDWSAITSSADGRKLAATAFEGQIHTSDDYGVTWTPRDSSRSWTGIASSADGTRLAATVTGGFIYTSSDSGATWAAPSNLTAFWSSIACSADGLTLVAGAFGGPIYVSNDAGVNSLLNEPFDCVSVTASADGTRLAAATRDGQLYTSSDSGQTWTPRENERNWSGIASSADGGVLAATPQYGRILTSSGSLPVITYTAPAEGPDSFTFQVQDDGENDFVDLTPNTITIEVVPNTPPTGTNRSITIHAGQRYFINPADWGFIDSDTPANVFSRVKITSLPSSGSLQVDGIDVEADDFISVMRGPAGRRWSPLDRSQREWTDVATSADGSRIAAVERGGRIRVGPLEEDLDDGFYVNLTSREEFRDWVGITSSADGSKLAAIVEDGHIYTSVDFGDTWTERETVREWKAIASSADGARLAAVEYGGHIYTSSDSGETWQEREMVRNWTSITSSADGTRLAAVVGNGFIYVSSDSGATWQQREETRDWTDIASSADGRRLVAVANYGSIHTTDDYGMTWIDRELLSDWRSVVSSADGARITALDGSGETFTSTNFGEDLEGTTAGEAWVALASSADGSKLYAVETPGTIYLSAGDLPGITFTAPLSGPVSFTFQVEDDGVGNQLDLDPRTLTFNITPAAPPVFTNERLRVFHGGSLADLSMLSGVSPAGGSFHGIGVTDGMFDSTGLARGIYPVVYESVNEYGVTTEATLFVQVEPSLIVEKAKRFKTTAIGKRSQTQKLSVYNELGASSSTISFLLTGTHKKDFKLVRPAATILEPGQTSSFQLSFSPRREGRRKAFLLVLGGGATIKVPLSGKGTDARESRPFIKPPGLRSGTL